MVFYDLMRVLTCNVNVKMRRDAKTRRGKLMATILMAFKHIRRLFVPGGQSNLARTDPNSWISVTLFCVFHPREDFSGFLTSRILLTLNISLQLESPAIPIRSVPHTILYREKRWNLKVILHITRIYLLEY